METLLEIQINENYPTEKKAEFSYPIKTDYDFEKPLKNVPELISEIKENYVLNWNDIYFNLSDSGRTFLKKIASRTGENNPDNIDLSELITKKAIKTAFSFIEYSEKKMVEDGRKILDTLYGIDPDLFESKLDLTVNRIKDIIDKKTTLFNYEISKINDSNEKNDYLIGDRLDKIQRLNFALFSLTKLEKLEKEADAAENVLVTYNLMNLPIKEKRDSMNHNLFMATLGEVEKEHDLWSEAIKEDYSRTREKEEEEILKSLPKKKKVIDSFLKEKIISERSNLFMATLREVEKEMEERKNSNVYSSEEIAKKSIKLLAPRYGAPLVDVVAKKTDTNFNGSLENIVLNVVSNEPLLSKGSFYESRELISILNKASEEELYERNKPAHYVDRDKRVESARTKYETKKQKLVDKQKKVRIEIAKKIAKRGYAARVRK